MKKTKQPKPPLEAALDFLSIVEGTAEQSLYARFGCQSAQAFNMIVGVGIRVEEDLDACPHMALFGAAITKCTEGYAVTQLSSQKLFVRSGEFHAYIPCLDPSVFVPCAPDAPAGPLDERFMEALGKVAGLASTTGEGVLEVSIQLNNGSVIATDRTVILEAWHGITFPDGLLLPKSSYNAIKKTKKRLKLFGFSATSLTIWFEDGSWLFTKLFQDKWPDLNRYLNVACYPHAIPETFFAAAKKVAPFGSGRIYVEGNLLSSHPFDAKEQGSGLALPFEGPQHAGRIYPSGGLAFIARHATKWDETASREGTLFYGDDLRGIINHERILTVAERIAQADEDIPF